MVKSQNMVMKVNQTNQLTKNQNTVKIVRQYNQTTPLTNNQSTVKIVRQ